MRALQICVKGELIEIEENTKYQIEVPDRTFKGCIIADMGFEYDRTKYFYIFDEEDDEDYQIADNEVISVVKLS